MDNKEATLAGERDSHSHPPESALRREVDSLDDFEHLGHDSSPLREGFSTTKGDILDSPARDELGKIINKGVATAAKVDLSAFDPLDSSASLIDKKMDSNLLEMGDNVPVIPVRIEDDSNLDKFLEMPSKKAAPPVTLPDFNAFKATQDFMDNERGPIQPKKVELLERYSDSEPEDDFKPSKYENFPKKAELPESFENVKQDTFKDFKEFEPEKPAKVPEPVKEKTPEPVKRVQEVAPAVAPAPEKPETKKASVIDAEAIFCKMGLVESLIYWRDPKKSGPVFTGVLLVLLALTYFSLISVVAYLSLLVLTGTISFRIYKNIVQAVQKTGDGHPFKDLLDFDASLSQEKVREVSEVAVTHVNAAVREVRRLFLVEDLVDSIKFGVLLWTLTYLGAWFNGMTLIIIAWVALFTLPKVYEANKTQIDANLEIVRTKLAEITSKVKAAIPIGKKTEEKKEQ